MGLGLGLGKSDSLSLGGPLRCGQGLVFWGVWAYNAGDSQNRPGATGRKGVRPMIVVDATLLLVFAFWLVFLAVLFAFLVGV